MNKKNIILVSCLVILAVALSAVYLLLLKKPKPGDKPDDKPTYFEIKKIETERINRVTLKTQTFDGSFSFQDDAWVRDDEEVFPVRQASVAGIVSVIAANLNAFDIVENPAALSEYGLSNPAADLCLYDGQELLLRLYVGNMVPTTDQRYYMKVEGDDRVFIVSENYHTYLVKERADFLESINFPKVADNDHMREVYITSKSGEAFHAYYDKNNPYDYSNMMFFQWYFTEPLKGRVNANFQSDMWYLILTRYTTIAYSRLVAFRPADLSVYGLNDPEKTVYVRYADASGREDNSYTLYIGKQTEEGTYAQFKGIDWVFMMDNDVISYMTNINVFNHLYQTVFYPSVATFDKVTMKTPREEWILQNLHTGADKPAYSLNGNPVSQESMTSWSSKVLQLKYCGIATDEEPGEEVFSIQVSVNNKEKLQDTDLRFYEYGNGVYLVSVNGVLDFMMDTRYVDDFIAFMRDMK